jgi:hypothetical protein
MRIQYVTLGGLAVLLLASRANAQFCLDPNEEEPDPNDVAACAAATATPYGALPTILPANWTGGTTRGIGFNFRFGSISEPSNTGRKNFGLGIDVPVGRGTFGLTGGLIDYTCEEGEGAECKSAIMGGASFAGPLLTSPMAGGQQSLVVGLVGQVGISTGEVVEVEGDFSLKERTISVALGLPVALVARSGNVTITPFIEPSFFWGRANIELESVFFGNFDESENGTGFALGGGVAFDLGNGFGLHGGFKKAFAGEAKAMIGVGLSIQR